jgi:putative hydrolase of the HAD superfamily
MNDRKPELTCFKKVLDENNLIAKNTLFIDDSIQHIKGAQKLGIKTYLMKQNESIIDLFPDIIQ